MFIVIEVSFLIEHSCAYNKLIRSQVETKMLLKYITIIGIPFFVNLKIVFEVTNSRTFQYLDVRKQYKIAHGIRKKLT